MNQFSLNGYVWHIEFVDPGDDVLIDRTNRRTVATTDPKTFTVYISNQLAHDFFIKVLLHELGHCTIFSYKLDEQIHRVVYPRYWIEAEEWVCNFIADYGMYIFSAASKVLGRDGWICVPREIELLIS